MEHNLFLLSLHPNNEFIEVALGEVLALSQPLTSIFPPESLPSAAEPLLGLGPVRGSWHRHPSPGPSPSLP